MTTASVFCHRSARIRLFHCRVFAAVSIFGLLLANGRSGTAQDFEHEPIRYESAPTNNVITRLQKQLDDGTRRLKFDDTRGYLQSLLQELNVPVSSQMLVYSKTSLQRQYITPKTPRAVYFNDDVYVGYCQNGQVMEISAVDPVQGAVFYVLNQEPRTKPRFVRQNDNCLQCHGTSNTRGVPGHVVRSVYTDRDGFPVLALGTHRVEHSTPIADRWGGWYVTGTHGAQNHLGNLIVDSSAARDTVENPAGQNVTELASRIDTSAYPSPHSDIVALMVLEHQAEGHNLITRASYQTREALYAEMRLNKELNEPEGHQWDSTKTRIRSACESLVKYLLFSEEARLTSPVQGTSSFAREFSQMGPRDSRERSLRDFDLERRLFKYPCSYLIYSPAFDGLPKEAKSVVSRRMGEILDGTDRSKEFAHLSADDRVAILEILRETKPDLASAWSR